MEEQKCKICMGKGWWPIGELYPIGNFDSQEWPYAKIVRCPECKAGGDYKSERYKKLVELYEVYKTNEKTTAKSSVVSRSKNSGSGKIATTKGFTSEDERKTRHPVQSTLQTSSAKFIRSKVGVGTSGPKPGPSQ